jgi:D-lyxose ketol-isomerase
LHSWHLPPNPKWDVTDFGLGDWRRWGLVLVNLTEQEEYCEKLMYARRGMVTPAHCHHKKKEDIICRIGGLRVTVWAEKPELGRHEGVSVLINGEPKFFLSWSSINLRHGERVTLPAGIWHEFEPLTDECIIGEVSTANDDANDNCFANSEVGRFCQIEEDEPAICRLVNER